MFLPFWLFSFLQSSSFVLPIVVCANRVSWEQLGAKSCYLAIPDQPVERKKKDLLLCTAGFAAPNPGRDWTAFASCFMISCDCKQPKKWEGAKRSLFLSKWKPFHWGGIKSRSLLTKEPTAQPEKPVQVKVKRFQTVSSVCWWDKSGKTDDPHWASMPRCHAV